MPSADVTPELGPAEDTTDIDGTPVSFGPLGLARARHRNATPRQRPRNVDIYNFTEDAHPIHLHLVQFQVIGRQEINFEDADEDGGPDDIRGCDGVTTGDDPCHDDVVPARHRPGGGGYRAAGYHLVAREPGAADR